MVVSPFVELLRCLHDVLQLVEEPLVYFSKVMYLVNSVTRTHSLRDYEDTFVGRFAESLVDIIDNKLLVFNETVHSLTNHTETFLDSFFESTSDSHHLTYRLHA